MLFIFASRSRPRSDRFLHARVALMCVGAGLGLVGMLLDVSWLIWTSLAALLTALGLRHLRIGGQRVDDDGVGQL